MISQAMGEDAGSGRKVLGNCPARAPQALEDMEPNVNGVRQVVFDVNDRSVTAISELWIVVVVVHQQPPRISLLVEPAFDCVDHLF